MYIRHYRPTQYIACYYDFLGQRRRFRDIEHETNIDKVNHVAKAISSSVMRGINGAKLLNNAVQESAGSVFSKLVANNIEPYSSAPREWLKYEMERTRFRIQTFSDSTLIFFPLNDVVTPVVLSMLLFSLAQIFLKCAYDGNILRGAICMGTGWETEDGFLYGPVLDKVAYMEKEIALYPRIVVTDDLYAYIEKFVIDKVYPDSLRLLEYDADGVCMLHYFSSYFLLSSLHGNHQKEIIRCAQYLHLFIRNEFQKFMISQNRNGDDKLYKRYRLWDAYNYRHEVELQQAGVLPNIIDESILNHANNDNLDVKVGKFFVLYLRIQPPPLAKLGHKDPYETGAIGALCRDMVALHDRLKQALRNPLNDMFCKDVTDEEKKQLSEIASNLRCGVSQVSNFILLYFECNKELNSAFLGSWLGQLTIILRRYAAEGLFVRGAISFGWAWEIQPGLLYGPAISEAASIEAYNAFYPRIVASKELTDSIIAFREGVKADASELVEESYLTDYLQKDEDGEMIFDFLCHNGLETEDEDNDKFIEKYKLVCNGYEKTNELVRHALNDSRKVGVPNTKVVWPLLALNTYFRSRIEAWNQEKSKRGLAISI